MIFVTRLFKYKGLILVFYQYVNHVCYLEFLEKPGSSK